MPSCAAPRILRAEDFRLLSAPPFNETIRISQAATWFRDKIYVGGGRGPVKPQGAGLGGGPGAGRKPREDPTLGAEIACLDPVTGEWRIVWRGSLDDAGQARDRSVRVLAVFDGALYAAVGAMSGQVVLLRSTDGESFVDCGPRGLGQGNADIAAVRNLEVLDGWLYTSPVGKNRDRGWADDNVADSAVVLRTRDPAAGWQAVCAPGFDDPDNESINEMIVFAGTLYAATLNRATGFQLWRAEGLEGTAPRWVKLLDRGAWRGLASPVPAAIAVFDGALYIGTGVQRQPGDSVDRYGPIAPELIRVLPDDTWQIVTGQSRFTPDGLRTPLSGQGPGFDDPFVQAFWRIGVHEGVIYVGGSDWRFWPSYLPRGWRPRTDISSVMQEWLQAETEAWNGDYGLWASSDGVRFSAVTRTGLGDSRAQYGIRGLLSTPQGLVAIPAARSASEGGVEVWRGSPPRGAT